MLTVENYQRCESCGSLVSDSARMCGFCGMRGPGIGRPSAAALIAAITFLLSLFMYVELVWKPM